MAHPTQTRTKAQRRTLQMWTVGQQQAGHRPSVACREPGPQGIPRLSPQRAVRKSNKHTGFVHQQRNKQRYIPRRFARKLEACKSCCMNRRISILRHTAWKRYEEVKLNRVKAFRVRGATRANQQSVAKSHTLPACCTAPFQKLLMLNTSAHVLMVARDSAPLLIFSWSCSCCMFGRRSCQPIGHCEDAITCRVWMALVAVSKNLSQLTNSLSLYRLIQIEM